MTKDKLLSKASKLAEFSAIGTDAYRDLLNFFESNICIPKVKNNTYADDISHVENNFEQYGFINPAFNGCIVGSISDTYYIGYYIEHYEALTFPQKIPTLWNKFTGNCYKGVGVSNSKYSLHIKQYEPVYEWQWLIPLNSELNTFTISPSHFTDEESKRDKNIQRGLIKIEETKRERKQ